MQHTKVSCSDFIEANLTAQPCIGSICLMSTGKRVLEFTLSAMWKSISLKQYSSSLCI